MKILYNKLTQARLLQLQRKQVTVNAFFLILVILPTRKKKTKKKKNKPNFWVATFLVSGDTRSQQSGRLYHISAYPNDINIYEQKYMKTILIKKKRIIPDGSLQLKF